MKGNYLRVRGEYLRRIRLHGWRMELPPRARRIPSSHGFLYSFFGTTSACAENTPGCDAGTAAIRNYLRVRGEYYLCENPNDPTGENYLRVRGEYFAYSICSGIVLELPPRARRIQKTLDDLDTALGTTSACAENTFSMFAANFSSRNYLRVRGEYCVVRRWRGLTRELPPRARRILVSAVQDAFSMGTTSACAENTH